MKEHPKPDHHQSSTIPLTIRFAKNVVALMSSLSARRPTARRHTNRQGSTILLTIRYAKNAAAPMSSSSARHQPPAATPSYLEHYVPLSHNGLVTKPLNETIQTKSMTVTQPKTGQNVSNNPPRMSRRAHYKNLNILPTQNSPKKR